MQYSHDTEQAREYSREAIARMKQDDIAPTPENYQLWYVYFSGQSPEVSKAIDALVAAKHKLTDERCRELFKRYLSQSRDEERIRRAGDEIHTTIRNVTGAVRDVKVATSDYKGKLGGVNNRISTISDPGELQKILSSVMTDTQTMIEHNLKLESQLDISSTVMEELQRDLEKVRREAMTDGLTGLSNRKSFDHEIKRVVDEAQQTGTIFTLMMLDIDHFKSFNDSYGHQVGDQVLRLVSKCLTDGVKGRDIAARYGGEEFVIVLPETGLEAGEHVANALRKTVATKDVINRNTGEKLGRITLSVGVAEYVPGESINALIERADAALYDAKRGGRNKVVVAAGPSRKSQKG